MKGLIILFARRPITVIMILAALIIAAIFSLFTLPVNRLPEFSVPRVTVETLYPGMAANEVRSMVTIPLEDGLSAIKGLEKIRSISRDNRSVISLDFKWGTDPMSASVLVREAVDAVYPGLPHGVRKPSVAAAEADNSAHAVISVSSHNGNGEFARKLAEFEIQARLRRIDGVGSVVIIGGEVAEEKISLDINRLAALGLTPSSFANLLAQETADIPAGSAREGNTEIVVVSSGKPDSILSLSQLILPAALSSAGALKVEDAGEIISSSVRRDSIFVYNGKEAAGLEIYRRPGADPLKLSRDIKKLIEETNALFSRDAQIEIASDSSYSLINGIIGLLISAGLGACAVITVLFLFLRRLKYSLLAALSIPISIAAGICVLSVTEKTLNAMSLSGLAIGIGLVSDISVIVLDLLHRAFAERDSAPCAEETGNKVYTISSSSAASTLTTALVFLPIIMLPGPLGSLFGDIAVTLASSAAAGWFYAQFCLPSLYIYFFSAGNTVNSNLTNEPESKKSHIQKFSDAVFTGGSLKKNYSSFLSLFLRKPERLFAAVIVLSLAGFFTLLTRPVVFFNTDDAEEVWVSVVFPPGTRLETITEISSESSKYISGLPSVKTVYGRAGAEEEDINRRADINYIKEELILRCILQNRVKPDAALAEINSALRQYFNAPYTVYFPEDRVEILLGLSAEQTYVIKGNNREELLERTDIARNIFNSASVIYNLRPQGQRPELRLYPDREAAAFLSIPAAQIAETLYILNEGLVVTKLENEGRPIDVRVTGGSGNINDPVKQLSQIPIRTGYGRNVYLGSLVKIERKDAEASLSRLDRSDTIYADITVNKNIQTFIKNFSRQYTWFTQADESAFERYRNTLLLYIILVLILLYMTMGAQFESFVLPLILMMSIPFSLAGAGPALLLTGAKIDSGAILGLTALFGLVVNNSLILFEISEEKIRNGFSPAAAVFCGARERFLAILITMVTTIFALLPLIFSPLGNSQKSMAAAMLGGLTASTLISVFAIPAVLLRYFNWKHRNNFKENNETSQMINTIFTANASEKI